MDWRTVMWYICKSLSYYQTCCWRFLKIECSYDSSRLGQHMYGHLSPPAVYHELKVLAGHVSRTKTWVDPSFLSQLLAYQFNRGRKPLDGLKIFITHIKESLVPHPEGKTQHEIIMAQLQELEKDGKLGVAFIRPVKGDRISVFSWHQADYNQINADAG